MKRHNCKIPFRSVGLVSPTPEAIYRHFKMETDKMQRAVEQGNTIYIRLDWGVLVDNLQDDPYIATE